MQAAQVWVFPPLCPSTSFYYLVKGHQSHQRLSERFTDYQLEVRHDHTVVFDLVFWVLGGAEQVPGSPGRSLVSSRFHICSSSALIKAAGPTSLRQIVSLHTLVIRPVLMLLWEYLLCVSSPESLCPQLSLWTPQLSTSITKPACSPHRRLRTSAPQPAIPLHTGPHLDAVRTNPINYLKL